MTPEEYKIWEQGYNEGLAYRRIVAKQIFKDLEKLGTTPKYFLSVNALAFIQELKKKYLGDD